MMYRWIAIAGLVAAGCGPAGAGAGGVPAAVEGVSLVAGGSPSDVQVHGLALNPTDAPLDVQVHAVVYDAAGAILGSQRGFTGTVPPRGSLPFVKHVAVGARKADAARAEVAVVKARPPF